MSRLWGVALVGLALAVSTCVATIASSETPPPTVRFAAVGDFSSSANAAGVLNTVSGLHADLALALGDMSYGPTGQEQAWCDFVTSKLGAGYPFELISGNHESSGENGNINDFSACLPNQLPGVVGTYGRQWYVDVPQVNPLVRYVMISPDLPFADGTWSYAAGTPRYAWTAAAIQGARAAGTPWVVVGMHKPCLSVGQYACESGSDLMALLVDQKVDLVLSGHEHLYQRSKQLASGPGCPAVTPGVYNAACVADADDTLVKGAGSVFATVGTGGVELRDVNAADPEAPYFAAVSGLNQTPTYGALDVTVTADELRASFARSGTGTFADAFTITRGVAVPNQPPVAAFTPSCTGLACTFDSTGSSDVDGTITTRAWAFGDGASGTGIAPAHTYATAGTYTVSLTLTDDDGATATTTRSVTVAAPPTAPVSDNFNRTVANGWGSAVAGGPWTLTSTASNYAVDGSVGIIRVAARSGPGTYLNNVSLAGSDLTVALSTDKPGSGGGLYISVLGRRVATTGDYRAQVRLQGDGSVGLSLMRVTSAGAETVISSEVMASGLTYAVGDVLLVHLQVTGSAPTTIRAKVWKQGTAEPAAWLRSVTDATSGLQGPGGVGFSTYLSGTATNSPIAVRVDDLRVTAP